MTCIGCCGSSQVAIAPASHPDVQRTTKKIRVHRIIYIILWGERENYHVSSNFGHHRASLCCTAAQPAHVWQPPPPTGGISDRSAQPGLQFWALRGRTPPSRPL